MKSVIKQFLLFSTVIWLLLGMIPRLAAYRLPVTSPPAASAPPIQTSSAADTFRILNEADGTVITVEENEFLPCALLCEMPPDAPKEALKAQAVAIYTTCCRMRLQNLQETADFTCDTTACRVYAPPEILSQKYKEDWKNTFSYIQELCAEVAGCSLYYDGELITAPYFPVSAGCTQSYADVWGDDPLPYLQAVACPIDRLHSDFLSSFSFTPQKISAAFPHIPLSDEPADWFTDPETNASGYVKQIKLCETALSGTQVRQALSLRSAAFTVDYDGETFNFTVCGTGHGVGMSQSAAVYMAKAGMTYTDILSCFYPGAELRPIRLHLAED